MKKERFDYISSQWKNTLLGKHTIANANYEVDGNDEKRKELARELFDPQKPWITIEDREQEFAKELSKTFNSYDEWREYIEILHKESPKMKNVVEVSGVTDGFLYKVGAILSGGNWKGGI
jgi:uncharacterized coiled-coil DUF342 family protein